MIFDIREYNAKKIGTGSVAFNNQPDNVPTTPEYNHTDPLNPGYTWQKKLADVRRLLNWYEAEVTTGPLADHSDTAKLMVLRGILLGEGGWED